MIIRKAESGDKTRIAELYWQSDDFHFRNEPYFYQSTSASCRSDEYLTDCIARADGLFLVAEDALEIVGFAYGYEECKGHFPFHRKRTYFCLDNIVVDRDRRGRGYGSALMQELIEHSRRKAYDDIILNVYHFNADAIRLYEKLGFTELSRDMILKL